jgi:hypothetical protein
VEGLVAKGGVMGWLVGLAASALTLYLIGFDSILDVWKHLLRAMVVFGLIGGVAAWACGRRLLPKGVKDQRAREQHPSVQRKIREGWKIGPKPPGL